MLGTLKLPLSKGYYYTVVGGPYRQVKAEHVGVKLAAEINHPHDINIPTQDFSVPAKADLDAGLLAVTQHVLHGDPVYVGCMAGRGRTGLFLSILARAWGIENPINYVRRNYYSHAVETVEQANFVMSYQPALKVRMLIRWAKLKSYLLTDLFHPEKDLTRETR